LLEEAMIDLHTSPCPDATGSMPEIFRLIAELEKRFRQFQGYTLKEARLTPPQYFILSLLSDNDGRPFKELAEALACTRATVTGIVDTLEKKALVTRTGLESTFESCCCELLPPEESRELSRLLMKLSDALPF
jgi:hypothetical protein